MAYRHERARISQLQLCGDISSWQTHFVNEHEGRKHDETCQYVGKGIEFVVFTPSPSQIVRHEFFGRVIFVHDFEGHEISEKLQICV
jgi:hypothetical protein